MKIVPTLVIALACGAPLALKAGEVNIGVNIGVPVREEIVIREQPPGPVAERIAPAPGPDFFWVRGHWAWRRGWVWVAGYWEHARPAAAWVAGHWNRRHGGWVWVEGYWIASAPVVVAPPPPPPGYVPAPGPTAEVVVAEAPPPPIVEQVGPSPGREYFWIEGRWAWQGRWVWIRGRYERHPHWHPGGRWIPGHWEPRRGGNLWIEGRWI